jgi:hypothetical protein
MKKKLDSHIHVSLLKKHLTFHREKKEENKTRKQLVSKIRIQDFFSINEIHISKKIKEIPYYYHFFHIFVKYDYIHIGECGEKRIEKIDNFLDTQEKRWLFQYKKEKIVPFYDFLCQFRTPKPFLLHIFSSFHSLLHSLLKLHERNICFFNLSCETIAFHLGKPVLHDFRKSIQLSKLNEYYITHIVKHTQEYTYKPLEVHVLFYLIENDLQTISYEWIEEITETYVNHVTILSFFPENVVESFRHSCIETLKKYMHKQKSYIVYDILTCNTTWDHYSLSVLYIHLLGNICTVFSLENTWINAFLLHLVQSIWPDPSTRTSLEKTLEVYENLYEEYTDWSFVSRIPQDKMRELFEILEKE